MLKLRSSESIQAEERGYGGRTSEVLTRVPHRSAVYTPHANTDGEHTCPLRLLPPAPTRKGETPEPVVRGMAGRFLFGNRTKTRMREALNFT